MAALRRSLPRHLLERPALGAVPPVRARSWRSASSPSACGSASLWRAEERGAPRPHPGAAPVPRAARAPPGPDPDAAVPGVMHALMFWGFCVLLLGTVLATIDYDITLRLPLGLDFKLLQGPFYLCLRAVARPLRALLRRGPRAGALPPVRRAPEAHRPDLALCVDPRAPLRINVTGFVLEACRLAVVKPWWAPWSPVGWALGQLFVAIGMGGRAPRGCTSGPGSSTSRSRSHSSR